MKTLTLKKQLNQKLTEWDNKFIIKPFLSAGYNDFLKLCLQAHDEIVGEFMCENFNNDDDDLHWSESDEANAFYESVACDIRSDADFRMRDWASENDN